MRIRCRLFVFLATLLCAASQDGSTANSQDGIDRRLRLPATQQGTSGSNGNAESRTTVSPAVTGVDQRILSQLEQAVAQLSQPGSGGVSAVRAAVQNFGSSGFTSGLANPQNLLGGDKKLIEALSGAAPAISASAVLHRNMAVSVNATLSTAGEAGLRVLGGLPDTEDVFPDVVLLKGDSGDEKCSGILIDPRTVLTAAHCHCGGANRVAQRTTGSLDKTSNSVSVDRANIKSMISCTKVPGQYIALNGGDLAIFPLQGELPVAGFRKIATETVYRSAAAVRAVGFGRRGNDSVSGAGTKFYVDIAIASYDCSDVAYPVGTSGDSGDSPIDYNYRCGKDIEMIAAGFDRDTCGGDSGGPIFVTSGNWTPLLAGITSRAVTPEAPCGEGGIYTRLSSPVVRAWLESNGVSDAYFAQ